MTSRDVLVSSFANGRPSLRQMECRTSARLAARATGLFPLRTCPRTPSVRTERASRDGAMCPNTDLLTVIYTTNRGRASEGSVSLLHENFRLNNCAANAPPAQAIPPAVSRRPALDGTWPEILRHRGRRSVAERQEAAIPPRRFFASHARLSAKRSTVWSPSVSFSTSPTSRPNATFQYVEPGTTISLIMNQ